jgi:hypothetical protein
MTLTADQRRAKSPPPAGDDPRYRRTCTRCGHVRNWTDPFCVCGNPEFGVSKEAMEITETVKAE